MPIHQSAPSFCRTSARTSAALLSRERLRRPTLLLETPLCGFILFLVLGLRLGISAEERNGLTYPFWGFGFWVALFSVFPVTWVRHRKVSRGKPMSQLV
jgi:hypothetical protein